MRSKVRDIPVRMGNGKAIGTAEVEYDSEAAGCWVEIVLNRELARDLVHGMEVGSINGLSLDASYRPAVAAHPHIDDFDLDPENRSIGEQEIRSRFGFHNATIEGPNATAPRHAYLRNEFMAFADMLDRVLPPGRYKSLVITALEETSMWSHKSIAETAPIANEG